MRSSCKRNNRRKEQNRNRRRKAQLFSTKEKVPLFSTREKIPVKYKNYDEQKEYKETEEKKSDTFLTDTFVKTLTEKRVAKIKTCEFTKGMVLNSEAWVCFPLIAQAFTSINVNLGNVNIFDLIAEYAFIFTLSTKVRGFPIQKNVIFNCTCYQINGGQIISHYNDTTSKWLVLGCVDCLKCFICKKTYKKNNYNKLREPELHRINRGGLRIQKYNLEMCDCRVCGYVHTSYASKFGFSGLSKIGCNNIHECENEHQQTQIELTNDVKSSKNKIHCNYDYHYVVDCFW